MSPVPDIWLLRSAGERRLNRRHGVTTNFSLKFSKEESLIVRRDSQSLVVLPSLAQPGIVHFSGRQQRRGSPGQPWEEGRMRDELGWLSLWREADRGDWQVPTPPPLVAVSVVPGRHIVELSWPGLACPWLSHCQLPGCSPTVGCGAGLARQSGRCGEAGAGPGPSSPHRSPDLSNVRRLIRWVSFWLESLGAKWDKIKKLKYWHRPV